MHLPDAKEGETIVFSTPPAKDIKKLLSVVKVKFVVRRLASGVPRNEILVGAFGGAPAHGLTTILSQLQPGAPVQHIVTKADCSQQLWIAGAWGVRAVSWAEDLFQVLARRKHPLCVIEDERLMIRAGVDALAKAREAGKELAEYPKTTHTPRDLISKLVRLSPVTRYVITCHMRGAGVTRDDRAEYTRFPQVLKVLGRTDSVANQKYLLGLVRRLYAQ